MSKNSSSQSVSSKSDLSDSHDDRLSIENPIRSDQPACHFTSNNHDEANKDVEILSRVSTGPPYTVFSKHMIRWIVAMNCLSAFISPTTQNIYFPAIPEIARDLGVDVSKVNLSVTTFMIFQALAPTVFGDLGDAAGRRPAFIIAMIIYLCANIGLALQSSYPALLVLRMLQSSGSSGTVALVYAVVADISTSSERGAYMGIVGTGLTVGPSIGPIIGGLLTEYLGWPSIFWFCAISALVWMVPYALAVPETGRRVVGNGSIPPQKWNMTLIDLFRFRKRPGDPSEPRKKMKFPIPNPLHTLRILAYKDMATVFLYNALLYVGFMVVTATISTQFDVIYGFSTIQVALCFLPIGVSCMVSSVCCGRLADWNFRRTAKKLNFAIDRKRGSDLRDFPIERVRIQVMLPNVFIGAGACIGYGWALQMRAHVAVPLVLTFLVGLCIAGGFQVLNMLIVDLYADGPATATAANNFTRCLLGAVAMAVIQDIIDAWGCGWAFTFIALLFSVASPVLWLVIKWGPGGREARRLKRGDVEEKTRVSGGSEA